MSSPLPAFPRRVWLAWLVSVLAAACPRPHANGADAPPADLLTNGGFEGGTHSTDNLWDGVDSDGYLAGFKYSAQVVGDKGNITGLAMPPSVALADLNGDGKPDLLVADPTGYFRFYPNHGTAAAPRFTSAELLPLFLSSTFKPRAHEWYDSKDDAFRFCPRFALADWRHTGLLDLLVCNYFGETLFVPNTGTARQPVFRQPTGPGGVASARLATSEKEPFWGNLFAPAAIDLDHRSQLDLLVGEGTYSANAIHLLRNVSNTGVPKFTDAKHTQIAYGDGREQLIPAVVDYDGDGNPDLLVADRTGEVGVYLNPGKSQPPGAEFKRVATLSFGGKSKLSGLCSVYAADFNGDGLFDIILGLSTGHIAVALNTGTKNAPTFGPIQELKGEDHFGRNILLPESWGASLFPEYGNALAYVTVVDATTDPGSQPPEGTHCLKAGYWPMGGEVFQIPPEGMPGAEKHFVIFQRGLTLNNNKAYELSFRAKATGMEKMHYAFISHYNAPSAVAKVERGERGENLSKGDTIFDEINEGADFSAGSSWSSAGGTLNVRYHNSELRDKPTINGALYIDFWATGLSSVMYLDDFKLVPR